MRVGDGRRVLGPATRSDAVLEGLNLLNRMARYAALARDDFRDAQAGRKKRQYIRQ